jgi:UDP-2-acetamido-2,6-beta-L-arabino-hexul-4-ose reductase
LKVLITGANGFIGKNLQVHLQKRADIDVFLYAREDAPERLTQYVSQCDFVFHLAGVNRPDNETDFMSGNAEFTEQLCSLIEKSGKKPPIIFTSSTQVNKLNPYGKSKKAAEEALREMSVRVGNKVCIYRLPNVFGKWGRPNYNSAVNTFCYNFGRGIAVNIHDENAIIELVYIDDVVERFVEVMDGATETTEFSEIAPVYQISVGAIARQIQKFKESRVSLVSEPVGEGFVRALYATYLSYLPPESFSYPLKSNSDDRGTFVEMIKSRDSGQVSFFTAYPGATRGGHFHHTKSEKFLVISGSAEFRFRNIITDETYVVNTSGVEPEVVETVPGWTHDVTNVGKNDLLVILWANEIFDREKPDTYSHAL